MLHDPGHGTCSAAATSVQANLPVVSQLLKSATALRHARGQEHTCRRQGNSVSGGKWLWHRLGQGYSLEVARAGTSLSPTNRTSHLSHWSRASHQRPTWWADPSHVDASVNRAVVWHLSKLAEAEGQRSVKLFRSANPGQLCSPLHPLLDSVREMCYAATTSVQVNLTVLSQLLKPSSELRHRKVSPLLSSDPPQHFIPVVGISRTRDHTMLDPEICKLLGCAIRRSGRDKSPVTTFK